MRAQPRPRLSVALLAFKDLPSCAAVMLICTVSSLIYASCLFSSLFLFSLSAQHVFKLPNKVSTHSTSISPVIVRTIVPQVFCLILCKTLLFFLIASFSVMIASSPAASS